MATFDKKLWIQRIEKKKKRAIAAGTTRSSADEEASENAAAVDDIAILMDWCVKNGLTVEFSSEGQLYYPLQKMITISLRNPPGTQLAYLLHECGHFLIKKSGNPRYLEPTTGDARLQEIDEEYEAWSRGEKLAMRLGLSLNTDTFYRIKDMSIRSYFKWALKVSQ